MENFKKALVKIYIDEKGEGYVDVLIKILISVIVGAALLAVMNATMPQLFEDIVLKIRTIFNAGI